MRRLRQAVWDAIDNWQELQKIPGDPHSSVFALTFRFDEEEPLMPDMIPAIADMPALAIFPANMSADWYTNQQMRLPYALQFVLFTADWIPETAEDLWEKICRALFCCGPSSVSSSTSQPKASYVRNEIGKYPGAIGGLSFSHEKLQGTTGPKLIRTSWTVTFDITFTPMT